MNLYRTVKYLKSHGGSLITVLKIAYCMVQQEAQLSLGLPTVLVVNYLEGHPRSTISILSERSYATSY